MTRFPFAFDARYRLASRLVGVHHGTAWVEVDDGVLTARFGPWLVRTPVANVATAEVTGPYSMLETIGPPHISLRDRGLTFATNGDAGACLRFVDAVRGLDPLGVLHHPGLTVTVADPSGLAEAVLFERTATLETGEVREEQHSRDRLHGLTASELRDLAREQGVEHPSSLRKDDLVDLLERELGPRLDGILPDADASD